ncbi:hypothetical protein T4E_9115 [Trichinella pseudospiralis]|uniref:Uncharacterized protein n=1 Tax=Trichinella pseudospiralis TaxID=6337 RepID=A0A0V0XE61_TRIPS|nr:hypothetical protein T4E_9115 [Trichinella pseudospiralis]
MHANFTSTALRTLARLQFQCLLAYGVRCVWNGVSPWLKYKEQQQKRSFRL